MKEALDHPSKLRSDTLELLTDVQAVIDRFADEPFTLSIRQIYYNLVDRWWERTQKPGKTAARARAAFYIKVQNAIRDARMEGRLDWDDIEDRSRGAVEWRHWASPKEVIENGAKFYRRELWETQLRLVEVHVEKDTVAGVVKALCGELDVTLLSHHGGCSITELYKAGERFRDHDKPTVIVYVGDFDPTGLDIDRSAGELWDKMNINFQIIRVAVTREQTNELGETKSLPVSKKDNRSPAYIEKYGIEHGWEAEALDPREIVRLVRAAVVSFRDDELWEKAVRKQEQEQKKLLTIAEHYDEIAKTKWKRKPK